MTTDPKKLLRTLLDPVLSKPGAGTINYVDGFLSYYAQSEDMPRIIGKGGLNIVSLKQVVEVPGVKLTIIEPGYRVPPPPPAQPQGALWKPDAVQQLLEAALEWRGFDARVHAYAEGDRWKFVFMEQSLPARFRDGLTTWAQVAALSSGGRIFFEQDVDAILQTV